MTAYHPTRWQTYAYTNKNQLGSFASVFCVDVSVMMAVKGLARQGLCLATYGDFWTAAYGAGWPKQENGLTSPGQGNYMTPLTHASQPHRV